MLLILLAGSSLCSLDGPHSGSQYIAQPDTLHSPRSPVDIYSSSRVPFELGTETQANGEWINLINRY